MRREKVLHALFHPGEVLGVGRSLVAAARTAAVVVHGRGTAPEIADIGEPLPHVRRADDLSVERHHVGLSAVGTCDGRDAAQHEDISHAEHDTHRQRYFE